MPGKVSVVVPVFNAVDHLARCLHSISDQSYGGLEILVVDDGSSDGSRDVMMAHAAADPRVRTLFQSNAGVSAARNAGLSAATGDYVSFVDADDWLEEDAYSVLVTELQRTQADFVCSGYIVDQGPRSVVHRVSDRYLGGNTPELGVALLLETPNRFAWTRLFRRDLVGATQFRHDLHWGEDTVFVVEVIGRARRSAAVSEPLYHYVQSTESATRSTFNPRRLSGLRMTEIMEQLVVDSYPQFLKDVLRMRVNVVAVLLQDIHAVGGSLGPSLEDLRDYMRRDLERILKARSVPMRTKLKAAVIATSPGMLLAAHRGGVAFRGGIGAARA